MFYYFPNSDHSRKFAYLHRSNGFTSLSSCFQVLINIQSGYLVFRQDNYCYLEPYILSHFTHQFGYDQLRIDNPNPGIKYVGTLLEGARAWYH